jgi:hypothetical protein
MTSGDDAASIKEAIFRSLNGNKLQVRSRGFVIACSGIENARIALNLPEPILEKINRFDNVGRYFAQHPGATIISVEATRAQARKLQRTFNIFSRPPRYPVQYILGFALSEAAQRKHELLNASAMVQYTAPEDSAWAAARRIRKAVHDRRFSRSTLADMMSIATNAGSIISGGFKKYVSAFEIILPNPHIEVIINLEQEPNRESCIRLGEDVDALGVRRVEVDWCLSEIERKTARVFAKALAKIFENLELGNCELASWLFADGSLRDAPLGGNYHFIGATRMASAPSHGVVDENCRAFGISNLFFAGTSVFPTGGHANPTLTIVALAIRLSDRLRAELASTTS